jgi:hypothetical protein
MQRLRRHLGVRTAGSVPIGNDHGARAAQRLSRARPPLAGTSRIRRRRETEACQGIRILLAFDDEDRLSSLDRCQDLRQRVEDPFDVPQVPNPANLPVWPSA